MVKQKLFVGANYNIGVYGKKLLVVGHQKHATENDRIKYIINPIREYAEDNDNIEMMEAYCSGDCMKWPSRDRKSWLQFGRMLSGDIAFQLGTKQCRDLLNSLAFCNYLQVPDFNLEARQGKDKEDLYIYSETIFNEYLDEVKPERIIVWGKHAYPYIAKLGKQIDDRHCIITMPSGLVIDVLRINHPCIIGKGGYKYVIQQIKDFML